MTRCTDFVVVGGGTAGWMSAAYLQKTLGGNKGSPISVTVIESDQVGIIGVGEATIPTIRKTMSAIEIPEWKLLAETDATFKLGIKFVDWLTVPTEKSSHFYHPFDEPMYHSGYNSAVHWFAQAQTGTTVPAYADAVGIQTALCHANRSPKSFDSPGYAGVVPYAYHLDAIKLGQLLKSTAIGRGVRHVVDHVVSVDLFEDGSISHVTTKTGEIVRGDFFIDCTGFRGVLIEKTLQAKWIDYSDRILCNSALALPFKRKDESAKPRNFTTASAKSAGWIWEIDLTTRTGSGYVYSDRHIDDESACDELLRHVGLTRDEASPRKIPIRVGRREQVWVKNCLSVGLSASFIEPLESTGIQLIEVALALFIDHLPSLQDPGLAQQRYNKIFCDTYDEIYEFILLHYVLNQRRGEKFWDDYRNIKMPDRLVENLRLWNFKIPTPTDIRSDMSFFNYWNYLYILCGFGYRPSFRGQVSEFIDIDSSRGFMLHILSLREHAVRDAPESTDVLQRLRAVAG